MELHGKDQRIPEIARTFHFTEITIYRLVREKDMLHWKAKASSYGEDMTLRDESRSA